MKRFGKFTAVDKVSFSVNAGEVFGFLGPNGAGKTTTMKMIQCVSPKTAGSLTVLGLDAGPDQRDIKKVLGVVPQENNLDPDFTVYENLLVYSTYFEIPRADAEKTIEKLLYFVQLREKKDTLIDKLSGGMKRRVVLARALLNNPRLLILDEPTVGLDPQAKHAIWGKIRGLKSAGSTIVLTTHNLDEAERLCGRLVIIDHGKVLVEGTPRELVEKYVGTDIVEAENNPQVVACLKNAGVDYEVTGDTVQAYTGDPKKITSMLLEKCRLGEIAAHRATLEDVFLKLTGRKLRE